MKIACNADQASGLVLLLGPGVPASMFNFDGESLIVPEGFENVVAPIVAASDWKVSALKASLKTYAAARRFEIETGGINFHGRTFATDRASQSMISAAYSYALLAPDVTVQFKTSEGFTAMTSADISSLAAAVAMHVQSCFAKEASIVEAIDAGSIVDMAGVDNQFAAT